MCLANYPIICYTTPQFTVTVITCKLPTDITLSLSTITLLTKNLFTESASTQTFTATDNTLNSCGTINFSITVTPPSGGRGDPGIITLPSTTVARIAFAGSSVSANVGAYAITIQAGFGSTFASFASTIIASASMTFTYDDPCASNYFNYFTGATFASTIAILGTPATKIATIAADYASWSLSNIQLYCGAYTFLTSIV